MVQSSNNSPPSTYQDPGPEIIPPRLLQLEALIERWFVSRYWRRIWWTVILSIIRRLLCVLGLWLSGASVVDMHLERILHRWLSIVLRGHDIRMGVSDSVSMKSRINRDGVVEEAVDVERDDAPG